MIELIIKTKEKRLFDAINSCTNNSIAMSDNKVFTSDIKEVHEIISITDTDATIQIIKEF